MNKTTDDLREYRMLFGLTLLQLMTVLALIGVGTAIVSSLFSNFI